MEGEIEESPAQSGVDSAENFVCSPEVAADKSEYTPRGSDSSNGSELLALRTEIQRWQELAEYRNGLLKESEWRYQELLQQLKASQDNVATLARAPACLSSC